MTIVSDKILNPGINSTVGGKKQIKPFYRVSSPSSPVFRVVQTFSESSFPDYPGNQEMYSAYLEPGRHIVIQ